jgi:hypothetical protein
MQMKYFAGYKVKKVETADRRSGVLFLHSIDEINAGGNRS